MNVLIAAKDPVFARMLALEFEEKNISVLSASNAEEIGDALSRAHIAIIDARFLKENTLPYFPYDIILFGYPGELAAIPTQELTKYYTVTRPIDLEDFFASLFVEETDHQRIMRIPKRKSPSESLALDNETRSAYYKGEKISLTQKEYALLALLYQNRGTAISRERALKEIFSDAETKTNVVDVYINYLRAKIDHRFDVRMIVTVRGLGYMIGK
ncbi:MAG: winged-helix domain-containing protein [Clostridia bacterium]|nr:winged-helix domain-containing protein [Clostridia bacterium]